MVIAKNSGAVTSMPNTNPIIFEVQRGSPLPELLAECGYDVIQVGEAERLMPITEVLTEQETIAHPAEYPSPDEFPAVLWEASSDGGGRRSLDHTSLSALLRR